MSVATQTFGRPLSHSLHFNVRHSGSFAAIGARVWLNLAAKVKARIAAASEARASRELLALAQEYETSMPSFAAELRAAYNRRS
ncbi:MULTISPECIES: hypothetical protein [unclassified Roseateles]|uniref:hypothetical protein n=1 Tax=unclassified Roseateles TaxID=2626991 RepID=UPI000733ACA1|nr:hypothetical protein [Paucibacter sp. KCTC 42545]ALT79105.1 hypothetical protein AT984_19845 [Paucibacter sp. KCTC 42545]MBY0236543.1 hypothetical protein [Burkholderiaceae bacterium]